LRRYRARFARLYLEHKVDLGVPNADDASIVAHVDDITFVLMRGVSRAVESGNVNFMTRFSWFADACAEVWDGAPNWTLDG
jgi:hypothetical protein